MRKHKINYAAACFATQSVWRGVFRWEGQSQLIDSLGPPEKQYGKINKEKHLFFLLYGTFISLFFYRSIIFYGTPVLPYLIVIYFVSILNYSQWSFPHIHMVIVKTSIIEAPLGSYLLFFFFFLGGRGILCFINHRQFGTLHRIINYLQIFKLAKLSP